MLIMNLGILAAGGVEPPPPALPTGAVVSTSGEVFDLGESGLELGLIRPPTAVGWAAALSLAFCAGDCSMTMFGNSIHWGSLEGVTGSSLHWALRCVCPVTLMAANRLSTVGDAYLPISCCCCG